LSSIFPYFLLFYLSIYYVLKAPSPSWLRRIFRTGLATAHNTG